MELAGEPACAASVSAVSWEFVVAGEGAGAGLTVCSSGVAAMSWLDGAGLELTGAGEIVEGCVSVDNSAPGTASWLVGVELVEASAGTVSVVLDGCDFSCAGVGACVSLAGVELALADVGEAVGA